MKAECCPYLAVYCSELRCIASVRIVELRYSKCSSCDHISLVCIDSRISIKEMARDSHVSGGSKRLCFEVRKFSISYMVLFYTPLYFNTFNKIVLQLLLLKQT